MTDALLASILDRPDDDLPRLVYADWLDEHHHTEPCECDGGAVDSGGTTPWGEPVEVACGLCKGTGEITNGNAERAEFIRVQCGIADIERERARRLNDDVDWKECTGIAASWCGNCGDCSCKNREESMSDKGCPLHDPTSKHCCIESLEYQESRLKGREREMFDRHKCEWFGERWAILYLDREQEDSEGHYHDLSKAFIRRGFVEAVRLPLAAFLGGRCGRCGLQRVLNPNLRSPRDVSGCTLCHGAGRAEGIAKRLFENQPVTRVEFTDREPFTAAGNFHYWPCTAKGSILESIEANRGHFASNDLPPELFDHIKGDNCDLPYMEFKSYDSPDLAVDAASDAAVALGRSLANLRPLEPVA